MYVKKLRGVEEREFLSTHTKEATKNGENVEFSRIAIVASFSQKISEIHLLRRRRNNAVFFRFLHVSQNAKRLKKKLEPHMTEPKHVYFSIFSENP